jgi:putative transcriptional regulator
MMVLGYAGWGPGQLDREIQEGSWLPVDLDPGLVFDIPFEDRWSAAFIAMGVDPARVVSSCVADA